MIKHLYNNVAPASPMSLSSLTESLSISSAQDSCLNPGANNHGFFSPKRRPSHVQQLDRETLIRVKKHSQALPHIEIDPEAPFIGLLQLPLSITEQIEAIFNLLQQNVYENKLCSQDEMLVIYNFQLLYQDEDDIACAMDMVAKPKGSPVDNKGGRPVQVVIHEDGRMTNNAAFLAEQGIDDEEEPVDYGNFTSLSLRTTLG